MKSEQENLLHIETNMLPNEIYELYTVYKFLEKIQKYNKTLKKKEIDNDASTSLLKKDSGDREDK